MDFFRLITLPLFSILLLFLLHSPPVNGDSALSDVCGSTNFTANSTYQSNLNLLLPSLATNATNSTTKFGFSSGIVGSVPNQISGLVLCRGDVNSSRCSACLTQATKDVQNLCPYNREAIIYYDNCLLRFSDEHFLTSTVQSWQELGLLYNSQQELGLLYNTQNVSGSITRFDDLVSNLLNSTAYYASNTNPIKFGTGMMNSSSLTPVIYGLVQCIPDLSDSDCITCLQGLFGYLPRYFSGSQGARILGWQCNFRYETYTFYNGVSMVKLTPPQNTTTAPSPSPSPSSRLSPPVISPTGGNEEISIQ